MSLSALAYAPQGDSPNAASPHIDTLVAQILSAPTLTALNTLLKGLARDSGSGSSNAASGGGGGGSTGGGSGGGGEAQLLGFLSDGRDPLEGVLDVRTHGLALLYILSARINGNFEQTAPPTWPAIRDFCRFVDPKHAALAPERVTRIARGIYRLGHAVDNLSMAVPALFDLVTRLPASAAHLTPLHPIFMLACVATRQFIPALPVLANPITEVDTTLNPDLTYTDSLTYHYTAGIALAGLQRWDAAASALEIAVCTPCSGSGSGSLGLGLGLAGFGGGGVGGGGGGHAVPTGGTPAALQLEALKKLTLIQLISTGSARPTPRYSPPLLSRMMRGGAYAALANAFPDPVRLKEVVERESGVFEKDRNAGLVRIVCEKAPRWILRKLTDTYATLHLGEVASAAGLDGEEAARQLVLSMIDSNEITAQITAHSTVSFADPPPQYSRAQVDAALRGAQAQGLLLSLVEREISRGREYLSKAVKTSDSTWAPSVDEEMFAGLSGTGMWEETIYS